MTFELFVARISAMLRVAIPPGVAPGTGLYDDLGLDSFQAFELLIVIESLAEVTLPPMDLPQLFTLGDAFEYYRVLRSDELARLD